MVRHSYCIWLLAFTGLALLAPASRELRAEDPQAGLDFFEKKIRPVLVKSCYECHSAEAAKSGKLASGLQLDTRQGTRQGGDSGPAVVPNKPDESLLLAAMRHEEGLVMPPESDRLSDSVLKDFADWISMGAPDPRDGEPVAKTVDIAKAREFWSMRPVVLPDAPSVETQDWARGNLDRFVLAKLESKAITPVGDASHDVLVRRLFFDLTGLPPTPADLERLRPVGIEAVVDELLASPHFGERWGRHWLDVARFAESNGRARNMAWHHAWRYRNWVIDAFNADLPYDQFVKQQIAGDLMPADDQEQRDRQVIATGYLALGPKSLEETNRELFRMDQIDEQIDVISRGLLGLSVSCARCHDHKFDPVPTADYYALAGILRSTDTLYGIGPMGIKGVNDAELAVIGEEGELLAGPAAEHLQAVKDQTQKRNTARSDRYRVVRRVADNKRKLEQLQAAETKNAEISDKKDAAAAPNTGDATEAKPEAKPETTPPADPEQKPLSEIETLQQEIAAMEAEIKEWDDRIKQMDEELATLVANPPPQPLFAMGARDDHKPEDCRIRVRGEPTNYGKAVQRGVLQAITVSDLPAINEDESGRLQLAHWLSSAENPLTARVMVNRIWLHLFGRGLVDTPDDFGFTGSPPSHPLLLDYLASRFMEQGWSIKKLIREIVLSRTYQLASESAGEGPSVDPDNVLLWRMSLRRLEIEAYRDALLTVSGELDRARPEGSVIQQIGVFSAYEFNFAVKLTPEMATSQHRTVYLPVVRGSLPEIMQLFDFADPNSLIGKRDETTVPSQTLYLMNSPRMIELAGKTAKQLLADPAEDDAQRLERLFLMAYARKPSAVEQSAILTYLTSEQGLTQEEDNSQRGLSAWLSVCQSILASSEFRHIK